MPRVAVVLGSNVGDRAAHLAFGRNESQRRGGVAAWETVSSIYETNPVGPVADQPAFLNQVAVGETNLTPRALLNLCQNVEQARGRERTIRWGPRTLDLDILLYDDQIVNEPDLTIPHGEMTRRAFVLVPLAEIAPDWRMTGSANRTTGELLERLPEPKGVCVWRSSATKR